MNSYSDEEIVLCYENFVQQQQRQELQVMAFSPLQSNSE